ncbi:MAG: hypothetical protein RR131_08350 [Anaerovorax sp.]
MKNYVITLLLFLCVFGFFLSGVGMIGGKTDKEGAQILEDALRRASVQCYATEGVYPPSADYLVAHYGIHINESKYTVRYSGFASNLMPDITVIRKEIQQ